MTVRLRVLAMITVGVALTGCTSTIAGRGSLAADSGSTGDGERTDPPGDTHTVDPGDTDPPDDGGGTEPTADPPEPRGDPADATITRTAAAEGNEICQIFSDDDIAQAFGESVTVDEFGDVTCQLEATDSVYILISHWDSLTPRDAMFDAGAEETTIAGHPALRGDGQITVAVAGDLDTAGAVDGSEVDYDGSSGFPVLTPLLEKAVSSIG